MKKILFFISLIFVFPNIASAHTTVSSSSPSEGEVITEDLRELRIEFAGAIENQSTMILVKEKEEINIAAITVNDQQMIGKVADPLENGNYILTWKIASTDGHVLTGDIPFTIAIPEVENQEEDQGENSQASETKENIEENNKVPAKENAELEAASKPVKDNRSLISTISVVVLVILLAFGIWLLFTKRGKVMNQLIPITEYVTYMLFSYLVGFVVLQFVPASKKPTIQASKQSLLLSVLGIIILTFFPVLQVISYFSTEGLLSLRAYAILTEFQVGIAWLYGSFFAVFLWMILYVEGSKYLQALFLLLMIVSVGYASHSSTLDLFPGLYSHSIHFLTITIWVGILIHVGWLSRSFEQWHSFLHWFTPLSMILFLMATISGIFLIFFVVEPRDYANAWVLPYGQMLLLKHLSIIPVLAFALINGFLARKAKNDSGFDAQKWIQAETVLLMIVFFITGVLGTLPPPHQVNATVIQEGAAFWVKFLLGYEVAAPFTVKFSAELQGILLLVIAMMFLVMIIISFYKKVSPWIALSFGILFIIATYLGLMMSLVV